MNNLSQLAEDQYCSLNYEHLPITITKGKGIYLFDDRDSRYFDFLSGYSVVNQGHCHPRLIEVAIQQLQKLTLCSRSFYNDQLGLFSEYICNLLGYDRVLPMNTGAEATETAIKLARKYAYEIKNVPSGQAKIVVMHNNFMGRTMGSISGSTDYYSYHNFGPLLPGFVSIPFNDVFAVKNLLQDPTVCAIIIEPIQGEAGVFVPDEGYLTRVRQLCTEAKVLMIADEIQSGMGRSGKFLACDYEEVKPDLLLLGKAITGGVTALSVVLGSDGIISLLQPGMHGSTYGGNPLTCAIALEAIKVIIEEKLAENAFKVGEIFRDEMAKTLNGKIKAIRGRGLLNAIAFDESIDTTHICHQLMHNGILAKPTRNNAVRFTPPLIINPEQMASAMEIIYNVLATK
ncbi:MAG: ornithine aminotransferase, mitochondrial [Mucilaginibacter sp.]|nr:ornithine aminotransferase, mitochondrial [Mucilaginibacter sp.]